MKCNYCSDSEYIYADVKWKENHLHLGYVCDETESEDYKQHEDDPLPSFQFSNVINLCLIVLDKLRKQESKCTQTHLKPKSILNKTIRSRTKLKRLKP